MSTLLTKLRMLLDEDELPKSKPIKLEAANDRNLEIPKYLLHNPHNVDLFYANDLQVNNLPDMTDADEQRRETAWEAKSTNAKKIQCSKELLASLPVNKFASLDISKTRPLSVSDPSSAIRKPGHRAPKDMLFCPVLAISKYPYKYVNPKLRAQIAEAFFDANKFWSREWDIYYSWPPFSVSHKPLLLIPAFQVQRLLADINKTSAAAFLTLSSESEDSGLTIRFSDHPALTPRYLGQSRSRVEFNILEQGVPSDGHRPDGETRHGERSPTETELKQWKRKMEASFSQTRINKKSKKASNEAQRRDKKQKWRSDLKKTETFLGLRPRKVPELPKETPGMTWSEIKAVHEIIAKGVHIPPIDAAKPPRYPFYDSVIFIALDVELKEGYTGVVTEIGIATLDTEDIVGISPGKTGAAWEEKVQKRHIRVKEHLHHVNGNFVAGCPDKFEFGKSEIIAHAELPAALATSLRSPCSLQNSNTSESRNISRNFVLVGHDVKQDIKYLQAIGCHVYNFVEFHETIDTVDLYRALKHEWNPTSLGALLYEFDIQGWNLHNAGNDAAYTMRALMAMAIRSAETRGSGEIQREINGKQAQKMMEAANEAILNIMKEGQGWTSGEDGEDAAEEVDED